jgi:hypothetical protein
METKICGIKQTYLYQVVCLIMLVVIVVIGFTSTRMRPLLPDESNRVYSPVGFSMICPQNWSIEVVSTPDRNFYALYFRSKSRIYETLSVEYSKSEPMIRSKVPVDGQWNERCVCFLGIPGIEYSYYAPCVFLDQSSKSRVYICFERNDYWYKVGYSSRGSGKTVPHYVRTFFNTLRFSDDE